jgi:hypothetical protein
LSPRSLVFTGHNLTFICGTGKQCQGKKSIKWPHRDKYTYESERPCLDRPDLPGWYSIIKGYTGRELTFPSDKFRAIAALADLYKRQTKKTYFAGLWRESLLSDICWANEQKMLRPRPKAYRAPSWSWAAIDTETTGNYDLYHSYFVDMAADAVILDVGLQQEPPNTTHGQIHSGYLVLEGFALTQTTGFGYESWDFGCATFQDAIEEVWQDACDARIPVTTLVLKTDTQVTASGGIKYSFFGLILVKVASEQYQRVGVFLLRVRDLERSEEDYDYAARIKELGFERQELRIV